ncbi:hypothetical protein SeLEV6574_g01549 [Synchytrium endobioticum]|uniref:Uncharacterized protein n=1 Tax=Synchytrium endobioticum TaxID=286115 RepID=A0A507DDF5_9FUNG|nr:hypothetical protein SeLEV6574_g01549 [Synchytrium endobioticum]
MATTQSADIPVTMETSAAPSAEPASVQQDQQGPPSTPSNVSDQQARLPVHAPELSLTREEEVTLGALKATMADIQKMESRLYGGTLEGGAGAHAAKALTDYAAAMAKEHQTTVQDVLQHAHKGTPTPPVEMAQQLAQEAQERAASAADQASRGVALLVTKSASDMVQAAALSANEFSSQPIPRLREIRQMFVEMHKFPTPSESATAPQPTPLHILEKQFLSVLKDSTVKLIFDSALRRPFAEPALPGNSAGDKALGAMTRYILAMAHEHHMEPEDLLYEIGIHPPSRQDDTELAQLLTQEAARRQRIESNAYGRVEKGGVAALTEGAATKMKQAAQTEE